MGSVNYLKDKDFGVELVICKSSSISYPIHNHVSVFTIGIVLDGSIDLTVGKTTNCYGRNSTFVIPPYVPHEIIAREKYTLLSYCINKNTVSLRPLHLLKNITISLLNEAMIYDDLCTEHIDLLIKSLNILKESSIKTTFSELYIQELIKKLEKYPEEQVYIEEMALNAYVSKYHLIRRFKEEVGLTPHQFLMQNRVRKAQHMLSEFNTLTEVALTTGFCDQSHFIRRFQKIVGMTPTDYKSAYTSICLNSDD